MAFFQRGKFFQDLEVLADQKLVGNRGTARESRAKKSTRVACHFPVLDIRMLFGVKKVDSKKKQS